jgi:hypothetical protein
MVMKLSKLSPLFFVEITETDHEVVVESPRDELERRVLDEFLRRVACLDSYVAIKSFAQSVLDDMLQRGDTDPLYSIAHVRVGWWVDLSRHLGIPHKAWIDAADGHLDIEIPGLYGMIRRIPTRGLIDRSTLQIEVQLDRMIVEWFDTPRETRRPRRER